MKLKLKEQFKPVVKRTRARGKYKSPETKKSKPYSFRLNNLVDQELQKKANELNILTVHLIQSILVGYAEGLNPNLKISN